MVATQDVIDASTELDERRLDRRAPDSYNRFLNWLGITIVAVCCIYIFIELQPRLLFLNTTPTGGDTGAHVWFPAYLRDHLLPWRVAGWSDASYAGFPAGQFYFPFPALLIVLLDVVLPYNIAFKLVTALGPVLMPIGAYVFASWHPRAAAGGAVVRGRRDRLPVLQGRWRRDDAVRPPHHGRHAHQHARR